MNSKLYVPDPNQWVNYFKRKPADSLTTTDYSTIKLTSPVQSVVERAKSELNRINSDLTPKPLIMTSTAKQKRTKSTNIIPGKVVKNRARKRHHNKKKKSIRPGVNQGKNKRKKPEKNKHKKRNKTKDLSKSYPGDIFN